VNGVRKCIRVAFYADTGRANNAVLQEERTYDYLLASNDVEVKSGDYAVVKVGEVFKVTKVMEVLRHGSTKANKYAYAIFNDKSLEEALKKDEAKAALLEQMLERTKQVA
ncbi:hypothetical protein, partial [Parvimonas sp. D9]